MGLSIPKDDSDASEYVPSEEDTSESFAALVTANPLANLRADFEWRKADFERRKAVFESLTLTMDLSIPKDAPDASEGVPSEEDSDSFPNLEEDSETAALVTADVLANLKADFESQKADFESQLESLKKSVRFSLKGTKSRLAEEGKQKLAPDTFSFLVCSEILSQPFLLGITVFLFQSTIFSVLGLDLLLGDLAGREYFNLRDNPLNIPANVAPAVRLTQFIAIIISVLTQADIRTSLEQANEGYSKDRIGKEFGKASCGKWWFGTACRFLQGALGLFVTFLLLVKVDNVLDLLLNFTAIEFVSQLDNVAFSLAGTGYFGSKSAEKSEEIDEISYPQARDGKKRRKTVQVLLLGVVFSAMLGGWGVIVKKQKSSQYLCKRMLVISSQTGSVIESGFYNLTVFPENYLRGEYRHQNGTEESQPGFRFVYCQDLAVWTFSSSGFRNNGWGCDFTAKSAVTETFDLMTTFSSPWFSPRGELELQLIQHFCVDEVDGEFPSLNCRRTVVSQGCQSRCSDFAFSK
jgi:hypothetical protein